MTAALRQSPPGAELAGLLEDPALAAFVLRAVVRDLTDAVRLDGVRVSPRCQQLIEALYAAAHPAEKTAGGTNIDPDLNMVDSAAGVADDGHDHEPSDMIEVTGMMSISYAAERSGFPCRTLRRWAAAGKIRAHRVGPIWLIDPRSVKGMQ